MRFSGEYSYRCVFESVALEKWSIICGFTADKVFIDTNEPPGY